MNENERDWAIGLDWLGIGWREGCLVLNGMVAGLVFSAYPAPHPSPHSTSSQSLSTSPSTSI